MPMRSVKTKAGCGLIVALAACLCLPLIRREQIRPEALLSDGVRVVLHSVTRGSSHVADLRPLSQRASQFLPKGLVPRKWIEQMPRQEFQTPTNAIVLWVFADKPSMAQRYTITDTNGSGGFISAPGIFRPVNGLLPIVLDEWPRRDSQIAITLLGDFPERKVYGRLIFPNPDRSTDPIFPAERLAATATNGTLELRLVSLDVMANGNGFPTRAGFSWGCRARFEIGESGNATEDWVVQQLWLCDSGGNRRHATGPRGWTNGVFEIFGVPLWTDDPHWRLEVYGTRAANFPPEETATFAGVPMPAAQGAEETIFQTNLLGHAITLRSMRTARALRTAFGGHSMGAPGFVIELDSRDPDWVPKVFSILSDSGQPMRAPAHGYGDGYAVMRFAAPKGTVEPETLTIRVTVQRKRKFEIFAKPEMVDQP
jgi:hypothetical protein